MRAEEFEKRLAQYVEGAMTEAETAEFVAWLKQNHAWARRAMDELDFDSELALLCGKTTETVALEVQAKIERVRLRPDGTMRSSMREPTRSLRFLPPLAVAASLLAALGIGLWLSRTTLETPAPYAAIARVESVQGSVFSVQDTDPHPRALQAGDEILANTHIETGADGAATLAWLTEDATVELAASSKLETRSSKRAVLHEGQLTATVAPRTTADLFTIDTPNASAEVLGTRFRIQTAQAANSNNGFFTRLDVEEGRVRLIRLADKASVETLANRFAVAAENIEMKAYEQGTEWIAGRILFADDFETDKLAQWKTDVMVTVPFDEKESDLRYTYSTIESIAADRSPFVSIEKAAGRKPGAAALAVRIPAESDRHINIRPPSPGTDYRALREEYDIKYIRPSLMEELLTPRQVRATRDLPVDSAEKEKADLERRRGQWRRFRYDSFWREDDQGEACLEVRHYVNDNLFYRRWVYQLGDNISLGQMIKAGGMYMDNYVLRELVPAQPYALADMPKP